MRKFCSIAVTVLGLGATLGSSASLDSYVQTNIVSDLDGVAATTDASFVNTWGIAAGPSTPFWINENGSGQAAIYTGAGVQGLAPVVIPPPSGGSPPSAPTGIVFNSTTGFGSSLFIFDTEDGTISAWTSGSSAVLEMTSPTGSVYKGLAPGNNGSANLLYVTNFGLGRVDVFNSNFQPTTVSGGFVDPNLPAGYAPFNIRNINGELYVTYALQNSAHHDDVAGPGNGFVDVFDTNGNLLRRLVTQGALNSPWGLALAPAGFGAFSGDLLVGNFGDGTIHAYDPNTGTLLGNLDDPNGNPIVVQGLWGLDFGNGAPGQGMDTLFFTAGIAGPDMVEDHGLFGSLSTATPEPAPFFLGGLGLTAMALITRKRFVERPRP